MSRHRCWSVGRVAFCAFRLKFAPRLPRGSTSADSLSLSLSLTHTFVRLLPCSIIHSLPHSLTPPHSFFLSHIGHCLPSFLRFLPFILPTCWPAVHCVSLSPYTTHKHSLPMQYSPSRRCKGLRFRSTLLYAYYYCIYAAEIEF